MPCSGIVREASSCHDRNKYRDSQLGIMRRVIDLRTQWPKWHVSIKLLPPGFRKTCRK